MLPLLMDVFGCEDLFNRSELNFVLEAKIAADVGIIRNASSVALIRSDRPDFELNVKGETELYELVEVDTLDRKRGDERKAGRPTLKEGPSGPTGVEQLQSKPEWAATRAFPLKITVDGDYVSRLKWPRRTIFADPVKHRFATLISAMMAPRDPTMDNADPATICVAPDHYVEIGLDGQIAACCRAQDATLGYATSPEAFAKAWFGNNYRAIRASLQRDAAGPFPLPNCEACIAGFAPGSLHGRRAVDYRVPNEGSVLLDFDDWAEWPIETVQKEQGHCHIAMMPSEVRLSDFRLFKDDRPLGPVQALHDDIRRHGGGRYSLWERSVYFSSSDNSDARYNAAIVGPQTGLW
jgi:hypothetical protein